MLGLSAKTEYYGEPEPKLVTGRSRLPFFYLEDAVGASSAAYVAMFSNIAFWSAVEPRAK